MVTYAALTVFSAGAALLDLWKDKIYNRYVLAGLAGGLLLCLATNGWQETLRYLAGACLALLVMMPFYLTSALGAGDVKLLACMAVYLKRGEWLEMCLTALVIAAVYGAGKLVFRRSLHGHVHFAVPVLISVLLVQGGRLF